MSSSLPVVRHRFLDIARALALVSPLAAACGGGAPLANSTTAAPTNSASTSPTAEGVSAGDGPCRCSWDTNAAAAPRVCKKGEPSYEGAPCVPGKHYPSSEYSEPSIKGPLSPPELA